MRSFPQHIARSLAAAALLTLGVQTASAQNAALYGKVTTQSGNTYTGAIRWGTEEALWDDLFNATKPDNPFLEYLSTEQRDNLRRGRRYDGQSWSSGSNRYWSSWANDWASGWTSDDNTHQYVTRFGDIKAIRAIGSSRVEVTLKNGEKLSLGDGSNDVGATIQVMDQSLGLVKVEWRNLDRVDFQQAPADVKGFGTPLYGTLTTRFGSFTGFIQWDNDEAVGTDQLDGDSEDGKFSIQFDRIARLERGGSSSTLVKLRDGRSMTLRGSNDVNSENRGILVKSPAFGTLEVAWDDFESLDLVANPPAGAGYDAYPAARKITGTVTTTDGQTYTGELAYDLDENYDFELLNGKRGDSEYQIPFRLIKRIIPRGDEADVVLANGSTIRLNDSQDVNERHSGILVLDRQNRRSAYLAWREIREIVLN